MSVPGCAILLALWIGLSANAWANMANPVRAGDPIGEPSGALKGIVIERETLTIDLRPLATRDSYSKDRSAAAGEQPAMVEAVYHVRNTGTSRYVHLIFVANAMRPSDMSGVWLNDVPVRFRDDPAVSLPKTWKAPATTPAIGRAASLNYEAEDPVGLDFSLPIAQGRSTIRVRYAAVPTAYSGDSPTVYWQLAYLLAPARLWGGFGKLDVTVNLPAGWRAASDPALERKGDTLTGSFDKIPADSLGLTVQAPTPAAPDMRLLAGIGGFLLVVLLGHAYGRMLARRGAPLGWAIPISLLLGLFYAVIFLIAAAAGPSLMAERLGGQEAWTYSYGQSTAGLLLSPLIFLLGLAGAQTAAWHGRRRHA